MKISLPYTSSLMMLGYFLLIQKIYLLFKVRKAPKEKKAIKVSREHLAHKVLKARKVLKVTRAILVRKVQRATKAIKATL